MKLLLLNGNTDPAITALLARRAAEALPRLGLDGVALVPATARFGAPYIATRRAAAVAAHAVLEALDEHIGPTNAASFDAAIIACFGDPGLDAARETCPVPVTGMADASLRIAFRRARRIALLTGGAVWVPMLEEFALLRGHTRETVRVHAITPTGDMIARDPDNAIAALADTARHAIAEGAEIIVLGGAGLAGLAPRLAAHVAVPVLDSLDCALLVAAGR